jgi:hypothetical protein
VEFPRTRERKIVRESLLLQCRPAAHNDGAIEQHLERNDDALPEEVFLIPGLLEPSGRTAVHRARELFQPTVPEVLAAEGSREALFF